MNDGKKVANRTTTIGIFQLLKCGYWWSSIYREYGSCAKSEPHHFFEAGLR